LTLSEAGAVPGTVEMTVYSFCARACAAQRRNKRNVFIGLCDAPESSKSVWNGKESSYKETRYASRLFVW
jgi:hypothetical protein